MTDKLPTTGKYSMKAYRCECGSEREIGTNHWGECYSHCSVCNGPGRWTCQEEPPPGYGKPEPWRRTTLGEVMQIK